MADLASNQGADQDARRQLRQGLSRFVGPLDKLVDDVTGAVFHPVMGVGIPRVRGTLWELLSLSQWNVRLIEPDLDDTACMRHYHLRPIVRKPAKGGSGRDGDAMGCDWMFVRMCQGGSGSRGSRLLSSIRYPVVGCMECSQCRLH